MTAISSEVHISRILIRRNLSQQQAQLRRSDSRADFDEHDVCAEVSGMLRPFLGESSSYLIQSARGLYSRPFRLYVLLIGVVWCSVRCAYSTPKPYSTARHSRRQQKTAQPTHSPKYNGLHSVVLYFTVDYSLQNF
jgi:hypothetical protein